MSPDANELFRETRLRTFTGDQCVHARNEEKQLLSDRFYTRLHWTVGNWGPV